MKQSQYRERFDLGGLWKFRIAGGDAYTERMVPGSYHCCGKSEYLKEFKLDVPAGKRAILTTEGINYEGNIYLNGTFVGATLPYCHYSFDVTSLLQENNRLEVIVGDITTEFGPTDGWCCYSGIIRAIYIDVCPETFVSNIWFRETLNDDLSEASASVEVTLDGKADGVTARAELSHNGELVSATDGKDLIEFKVVSPDLWSPEKPELYDLRVVILKDGAEIDEFHQKVGFRKLFMDDKRFYLNGKPYFFAGICRHDLGSDEEGQTLSDAAIERDMQMIKDLGCNFVRLVHYPHDKRVVEIADRLGLFISEESGLWWSDMSKEAIKSGAINVLEKTILRDRSHACVAFWMSFNECIFTQDFLNDATSTCRRLDPDRYISGANCMNSQMTKKMFDIANIDFYTFHPYGPGPYHTTRGSLSEIPGMSSLANTAKEFEGKPLIFSEWGGWHVTDNPQLFTRFCMQMKQLRNSGRLAGMFYWAFADMYEFNRDPDACTDGIQIEGLVTIDRRPKINYYAYKKFIAELNDPIVKGEAPKMLLDTSASTGVLNSTALKLEYPADEAQKQAWDLATEDSKTSRGIFHHRKYRRIKVGPCLKDSVASIGNLKFNSLKKPVVVSDNYPSYTVNANVSGSKLVVLGNALYCLGAPIYGEFGEECARMTLKYTDGTAVEMPLRNGIELLTVVTTFGASKIDPISPVLKNAVTFSYDQNFENYRIYTLSVDLDATKTLESVTIESKMAERALLVYGMSVI